MNKNIINWGVISCAGIADKQVIPGITSSNNGRLYAISSRSEEKLEEFKGKHNPVKTYQSYDELLDDEDIDAVYIPLPNGLHCPWVIKAANKKKHILCEKPLGVSAEEEMKMKEACEENGVLLMEAFAYRHSPLTQKVKSLIEEGVIGKLKFIEAHFSYFLKDISNVRLDKKLAGGATFDIGCYNINLIRYLVGSEPISIKAGGGIDPKSGVDESSNILLEFEDEVTASSYCSFKSTLWSGYTVVGEEGIIEVPVIYNSKGDLKIIINKNGISEELVELVVSTPDNYMLEVEQFGRCILNGEKPLISFQESYGNAVVIDETLKQIGTSRGQFSYITSNQNQNEQI